MKYLRSFGAMLAGVALVAGSQAAEVSFREDFHTKPGEGWTWKREHPEAWRVSERGLEVRIEPGNMWGAANNARNVLLRDLPALGAGALEISVTVSNRPTEQYEQVDLVWYYDDSHMVKLGQELVDGKLCVVMGREERDRTRTIAILPLRTETVRLRLQVQGTRIRGEFRASETDAWTLAGECDLPANGTPKASLQFYQGPARIERWARVTGFTIRQAERQSDL